MRIVDVNGLYAPRGGGVRAYVEAKFEYAHRNGHEVIVIAPGREDRVERRRGGAIHWVAAPAFPLDRRYRMLMDPEPVHRLLDLLRPDVVEASSPWCTASIVADWPGSAPRHWIMHADPLAAYAYRWFGRVARRHVIDAAFAWYWRHMRRVAPSYASIVCPNSWLSVRLVEGGLPQARAIPHGVEAGMFSPTLRDEAFRGSLLASCGCSPRGLLLLGVGRHSPEKDWPMAIAAARAAGSRAEVALLLVGEGNGTPAIVRAIAGDPHVRLLEPTSDRGALARLMASADGLLHACAAETFCFVAAEAAASGLAVIAPDAGGACAAAGSAARPYRAGSIADAAERIGELGDERSMLGPSWSSPSRRSTRTMDDHFAELFGSYRTTFRSAA